MDKLLLTVDEASRMLGLGRSHVYTYVLRGELRSLKLGRARRIPRDALIEFVDRLQAEQIGGGEPVWLADS